VVPPASHKIARVSWYSGSQPRCFSRPLRDSHPLWWHVPMPSSKKNIATVGPTTPPIPKNRWFGLFPVRSPLLRESRLISSRRATEMFQFTHCPPSLPMCSAGGRQTSLWRGCPIRNLRAHRLHAAPPERFAGLRVLLRPSAPRHPPRTLCSLFSSSSCLLAWLHPLHTRPVLTARAWCSLWLTTPYSVIFLCVSPLLLSCSRQN
jgi:hypothetical protein